MTQKCHFCGSQNFRMIVDLGKMPLANSYIVSPHLSETILPLSLQICENCSLVQSPTFSDPAGIFNNYAYLSSTSSSWVEHAGKFCEEMQTRGIIKNGSRILEIACNDGYLLQSLDQKAFDIKGIEPATNIANIARGKGLDVIDEFFSEKLAKKLSSSGYSADLIVANNVFAHTPYLRDFIKGLRTLLSKEGMISLEVQYLPTLIKDKLFDTIYHEHFSYHNLLCMQQMFASEALDIVDCELLPTHGGSIRVFVQHQSNFQSKRTPRCVELFEFERRSEYISAEGFENFKYSVENNRREIKGLISKLQDGDRRIIGYGAPAKGNTLINYCGITKENIDYVTDKSPEKIGKYLPMSNIPIVHPSEISASRPDAIIIMPWNLKDEIKGELLNSGVRDSAIYTLLPEIQEVFTPSRRTRQ